jgi:FkbM family methyltransferase
MMISYAQNAEDVILNRAFRDQAKGFYIDVGAAHPEVDSVTKLFYDRGWSGINVEPGAEYFGSLSQQRPRDLNLKVALSSKRGKATLYKIPPYMGLSSLHRDEVFTLGTSLPKTSQTSEEVDIRTLKDLCEEFVQGSIDFLKVDVEGEERSVLEGGDFTRFRPRVIVVESTKPMTPVENHGGWEPLLLDAGYFFCAFDGLNRFYVRSEDQALRDVLRLPANVFDQYERHELVKARQSLAAKEDELREAQRTLRHLEKEHDGIVQRLGQLERNVVVSQSETERLAVALREARNSERALAARLSEETAKREAFEARGLFSQTRALLEGCIVRMLSR